MYAGHTMISSMKSFLPLEAGNIYVAKQSINAKVATQYIHWMTSFREINFLRAGFIGYPKKRPYLTSAGLTLRQIQLHHQP
jgi:hypothetical protein